jgi:hypothetical protein
MWILCPQGTSAIADPPAEAADSRYAAVLAKEGMAGYLREMGRQLDCYFTIEDDMPERFEPQSSILGRRTLALPDPEIDTVDELMADLERMLNALDLVEGSVDGSSPRVKVFESHPDSRVIHLMSASLDKGAYVMNERTDFEIWDSLHLVPDRLGRRLDRRIGLADTPRLPQIPGGAHPYVSGVFRDKTVRDVLTDLSPKDGHRRIIWASARFSRASEPKVFVGYFGVSDDVAKAAGYDQGKPPAGPTIDPFQSPAGNNPFGTPVTP